MTLVCWEQNTEKQPKLQNDFELGLMYLLLFYFGQFVLGKMVINELQLVSFAVPMRVEQCVVLCFLPCCQREHYISSFPQFLP